MRTVVHTTQFWSPGPRWDPRHKASEVGKNTRGRSRLSATRPACPIYVRTYVRRSLCLVARLSATLSKRNIHKGITPLLMACSTGCSDVVKLLCEKKGNIRKMSQGRGALQMASKIAGENNKLLGYLKENYPDLPMSVARCRREKVNWRGQSSYQRRLHMGPWSGSRKGHAKGWHYWHESAFHGSAWYGSVWHGSAWHEGGEPRRRLTWYV